MAIAGFPDSADRSTGVESSALVRDYLADVPQADDRLASFLTLHVGRTVRAFLNSQEPETEDLIQDAVMAVMKFLRRRGGFEGNLTAFANTVARNRCRNHLIWRRRHPGVPLEDHEPFLASHTDGPLDRLLGAEVVTLVQRALDELDDACRNLLRALYLQGVEIDEIRRREGLKSVQSIYYRRSRCLEKAGRFLKRRLQGCSAEEEAQEP